jgi:putative Ca2+/H+ antiporter (TMEM165/GDT1 family)
MNLSLIASTFGVIFIAELPDKTALASLVLATRHRARDVIVGAWLAFVVQTAVAVGAGRVLHLFPSTPIHVAAGLGFLLFAFMAWRRKEDEELAEEEAEVAREEKRARPAWLTSFLVVFAAEWGDLTQLATAALVARLGEPVPIAIGAVLALWSVTLIAVVAGAQVSRFLPPEKLTKFSAVLFAIVGAVVLVSATGSI